MCEYNESMTIEHTPMLEFKKESDTLLKTSIDTEVDFSFKNCGCLPISLKPHSYFYGYN